MRVTCHGRHESLGRARAHVRSDLQESHKGTNIQGCLGKGIQRTGFVGTFAEAALPGTQARELCSSTET